MSNQPPKYPMAAPTNTPMAQEIPTTSAENTTPRRTA